MSRNKLSYLSKFQVSRMSKESPKDYTEVIHNLKVKIPKMKGVIRHYLEEIGNQKTWHKVNLYILALQSAHTELRRTQQRLYFYRNLNNQFYLGNH